LAKTKKSKKNKVTPLMGQYFKQKAAHPDAILLFRVGDFYETFGKDAVTAAQVLGIVLTSRNNGGSDIELAGFPYHSLDMYLPRLVKAGYRVAICEQLEKPSKEKKIVKRGVTEIVTPGLATDDKLLDHKSNNYLASLYYGKRDQRGLALLDLSTGEFLTCEGNEEYIAKLLQSFQPKEVILSKDRVKSFQESYGDRFFHFKLDEWVYTLDYTREKLLLHFNVSSLKGFGIEALENAQIAAGAILHYLETTENRNLKHISRINRLQPERYVWLDRFTIRNLELLYSQHETGVPLVKVIDHTISPMGGRLLKKWVVLPLKNQAEIEARLDTVGYLLQEKELLFELEDRIKEIGDLERLISKVPLGKINPREVVQLRRALLAIQPIKEMLVASSNPLLQQLAKRLDSCTGACQAIAKRIKDDPPVNLAKGSVIANGWNEQLDDLRDTMSNGKNRLVELQQREVERTGISSLKVGFNNVFGYYLEVTNKYKNDVPPEWTRKQTLTNAERYITEELKLLEDKILNAEERSLELEAELYEETVIFLQDYIDPVQQNASLIARLDCLMGFARAARRNHYVRPTINEGYAIDIKGGRHPVIEHQLEVGQQYVPNDTFLDTDTQQIMMITGPNMAGKSALLRQTALICLMAQMGSFVPAEAAELGIIDKVFTRVGASDNISSGESTFMVEMNETASIMNNISDRSLVLLDEIGRGTSTFDGISIAWSIAEYLHDNGQARPKTLFATHYHELNELARQFERIKNFNIAIKEVGKKIIFLRKLVPGGSQHSFGIHVARMAGMPRAIVERAEQILAQMESQSLTEVDTSAEASENGSPQVRPAATDQIQRPEAWQLSIFETTDETAGQIRALLQEINVNQMTPIECMMKLNELKQIVEEES
jgi:DNA mismatch repair protein MutS